MSVMLIVVKKGTQEINFAKPCAVERGQNILDSQLKLLKDLFLMHCSGYLQQGRVQKLYRQ